MNVVNDIIHVPRMIGYIEFLVSNVKCETVINLSHVRHFSPAHLNTLNTAA